MDKIHHIAIEVEDIGRAVSWYMERFSCQVSYRDDTWAMLEFDNVKLALVIPSQHPRHVAFARDDAARFGKLKAHRDGAASVYVKDSEGNVVEIIDAQTL
jgi:extradiol dioxygenase family protein